MCVCVIRCDVPGSEFRGCTFRFVLIIWTVDGVALIEIIHSLNYNLQTQHFYSNFVIVVSRSACIVYTERSSVHRAKMPTLSPCDVKIKFVVYLRWMRLRLSIREKKCVYHSSVVNTLELFIVHSVILLLFSSFYCSMKEFQWRFVTNNTHKFPREKSVWF